MRVEKQFFIRAKQRCMTVRRENVSEICEFEKEI